MTGPIRVLLADDHPVTRAGIRAILEKALDIQIVSEAGDGVEARRLAVELCPHVLLLDLRMPGPRPSEIVRWITARCPETATLVLTAHDRDVYLASAVDAGAVGFLTKEEAEETLVEAVRRAARGEVFYTKEQVTRVRRWRGEVEVRWRRLTEQERRVLTLVADGKSDKEIAQELRIDAKTVGNHVSRILAKLEVASRTQAAVWAMRQGFTDQEGV